MSLFNKLYLCAMLAFSGGFLFGKENTKPHLTPEKVIGSIFPRDSFEDIQVAVVGYCPPASILEKYNPITLTEQFFLPSAFI